MNQIVRNPNCGKPTIIVERHEVPGLIARFYPFAVIARSQVTSKNPTVSHLLDIISAVMGANPKAVEWCVDNLGCGNGLTTSGKRQYEFDAYGRWCWHNDRFYFASQVDATCFKMVWG